MRRLIGRGPRRHRDDTGAAATLVVVLLSSGVLLGMGALSVDVGQLYAERRQVQNGADAAALAVAVSCAASPTCDTSTGGDATTIASANANDGAAAVQTVCGAGHPSLSGCSGGAGPTLTQCPAPPTGVEGWVRVRTATSGAGGTLLPPAFAQALAGNAGYAGAQVRACAQAAWGSPSSIRTSPLIFSVCEWDAATAGGTSFAPPPPYPPYPAGQVALTLHTTTDDGTCPGGGGGAYADLPGGFGWLDGGAGCEVQVSTGGTAAAKPGVSSGACVDAVASRVGTVLYLPVFSDAWGNGANGTYRVAGFAAFYLSGYNLPGAHPNKVASPVGGHLCTGVDKCIYGWFTQGLVPAPATIGPGPGMGARVVALTG